MHSTAKRRLIKAENLSSTHYLQSLLEEARRVGALTDAELESFRMESLGFLVKQIKRYTCGDTSSVRTEVAQEIMESILFTISMYLKNQLDPDSSLAVLKKVPLAELHKKGKALIREQVNEAKRLFAEVKSGNVRTGNIAYNDTIENGVPAFFASYDAEFAAHETPGSIDYPVSNDKMDLQGVEYMVSYLSKISLENRFCRCFAEDDINSLLRGYDHHYEDLLINIFTLVLTNAIGAALAEKGGVRLNLDPSDIWHLQRRLANLGRDELSIALKEAAEDLTSKMGIVDGELQHHIIATVDAFAGRIQNALKLGRLESVFIDPLKFQAPRVRFEEGTRMDDEAFRSLADEIRMCRHVADKVAMIKREIHSVTDLVDILEGSCLFGKEFAVLFQTLGDEEIALLAKRLPTHVVDPSLHIAENQKEWHTGLTSFLKTLDVEKVRRIKAMADGLSL